MPALNENLKTNKLAIGLIAAFLLAIAIAYYSDWAFASDDANPQQMVMDVEVEVVAPQETRIWNDFSGSLEAVDDVEVRPRVGGTITKILFEEGAIVKKGDKLFVIDPRQFNAALQSARANLAAANSRVELAKVEMDRSQQLVEKKAISKSLYDSSVNDYKVAKASVNSAKAALTQAQLDYEYANIKAPIDGRVSRAEITVGNVIEAGPNAPVLTNIVSNGKLYAEFDVDEQTYVNFVRNNKSGDEMPVEASLSSGDNVIYKGKIHSFDNKLDVKSGTIRARAILDNADGVLVPGMYVNVRLGSAHKSPLLMVSDKAIGTDQNKKYVYVIDADNKVEYRLIELGRFIDGKRVVVSGLDEGEKILVNGLQKVRPGMEVNPKIISNIKANQSKIQSKLEMDEQ